MSSDQAMTTRESSQLATVGDAELATPLGVYLAGAMEGSRRALLWRLGAAQELLGVAGALEWETLTYTDAVAIRSRAAEKYAPSTASGIVAAVKGVCRQAWLMGVMDGDAYRRISCVPLVKGNAEPSGRWVSRPELRALFEVCDSSNAGRRDTALLALLFGAGLRRGEVSGLALEDITDGCAIIRRSKGNKSRSVPLSAPVQDAINEWASCLDHGPLLRQVDKGDNIRLAGMSGEGIRRRLLVLSRRAGVSSFRPHDARRSYASTLLDAGADLCVVARLLGHSSVQVTAGYDRRGARAEEEAAALVRLPLSSPRAPDAERAEIEPSQSVVDQCVEADG